MEQKQISTPVASNSASDKFITLRIDDGLVDFVVAMAQRDGTDIAYLIANALNTHSFVQSARLSGKKLYLQEPNGVMVPVVFGPAQPAAAPAAKPTASAVPVAPVAAAKPSAPVAPVAKPATTAGAPVAPVSKPVSASTPTATPTSAPVAPVAKSASVTAKAV